MGIRKNADRHVPAQEQEPPNRTRRAVLTGGAVGLAAVAGGATLARSQPAEAQTVTDITQIMPSGTKSGIPDTTAIQDAINTFVNNGTGGVIYLGPGEFYITPLTTGSTIAVTLPVQVTSTGISGGQGISIQGCGSATVVYVVGDNTGFSVHRVNGYGGQYGLAAQQTTVFLRDFVVDGTLAGDSSVGVDIGDGWGYDMNLVIVNFTGISAVGLNIINRIFWTEKGRFRAQLMNNTTAAVLSTTGHGDESHEYNFYDFNVFCNEDQQGVLVSGGVNNGGCTLWLHGNMAPSSSTSGPPTSNVAALSLTGGSQFYFSEIVMKVEGNGSGAVFPYGIYFDSDADSIEQCHGIITHSLTASVLNGGVAGQNGGEFSFRGYAAGDAGLTLIYPGAAGSHQTSTVQPTLTSGTAQQNYGPDAMVYVNGGTVSSILLGSVPTNQTSGGFFVPAGGLINVTYSQSNPPTWTWVPVLHSPY